MVFSFFKKRSEKKDSQVADPAVKKERARPQEAHAAGGQKAAAPGESAKEGLASASAVSGFSDFGLSDASDYQIDGEGAPEDAEVEEAAIFFANGQDAAAQAVLESAVKTHGERTERPWLMLFDLYRLMGKQELFETLEIEYARAFEKSPPGWQPASAQKISEPTARKKAVAAGRLAFKGELLGSNEAAFEAIRQALARSAEVSLDVSKIRQCDPEGCARFLELLTHAGKTKQRFELQGNEVLRGLLQARIAKGRAAGKECWLLLLELCQLQGWQRAFDKIAIGYAMAFEESPPSWVSDKVALPASKAAAAVVEPPEPEEAAPAEGYVLRGEIKSSRFAELTEYAENHDYIMIDCAELVRMDFVSAGALLNILSGVRRAGKPIAFRQLNHMVAELFGIVGLKEIVTIDFAK